MSTGPRTAEGKATSSQNATKHGLTSQVVVTKNESIEEYEAFHAGMMLQYQPVGNAELYFANAVIGNAWRLRRAHRIEAETFDRHCTGDFSAADAFHTHATEFDRVRRYITSIERAMHRAMRELDTIQGARFDSEREQQESELHVAMREAGIPFDIGREFVSQYSNGGHNPLAEVMEDEMEEMDEELPNVREAA